MAPGILSFFYSKEMSHALVKDHLLPYANLIGEVFFTVEGRFVSCKTFV